MKLYILRSLAFSLLLFSLATCTTEEETITPREYPRLTTLPVTEVSNDGARLNAEFILRGDYPIAEYGFIYSDDYVGRMDFENSERISIEGNVGAEGFSAMISRNLRNNEEYHVKAYVRTADYLVLGEPVNFKSQGSKGPELKSMIPSSGHIGDEVEITSSDFGKAKWATKVFVEGSEAEITSFSETAIKFLIPDAVAEELLTVAVEVNGNVSSFEEKFNLYKPVISEITPVQTSFDAEVTLSGENFNPVKGSISVNFLGFKDVAFPAEIVTTEESSVVVRVPAGVDIKEPGITIEMNNMKTKVKQAISIKDPVISSFSSNTAKTGEEFTLIGKNFSPDPEMNEVRIDGKIAEIVTARADSLTVIIPTQIEHVYSSRSVEVSVNILGEIAYSDTFLQITDKWFRLSNVPFNNSAYIYQGMSTMDQGYVISNDEFWKYDPITREWQQETSYPGSTTISPSSFTIENLLFIMAGMELYEYNTLSKNWTQKTNVPYSGKRDLLTFSYNNIGYAGTGRSYDYHTYYSDMWKYDPTGDSWTQIANYPATLGGRRGGVATILNGHIYTGLGGSRNTGSHNYEMYKFDPVVEQWTRFDDYPAKSLANPTAFTTNSRAYFGSVNEPHGTTNLWSFDGFSWKKEPMAPRRMNFLFLLNDIAYFTAGSSGQFWIYDALQPD
ncbi:IPT/TIG domain-containing protein [Zeaxanthinibacter enoshimensis]|uniref:IPT/TIG domain-containing protein n=1 Tax=Zeaxanthinibacter enoshimensis TaxID=392009 RepID=A0A4R6TPX1_9FLAO|nr:IPT/TIG domain-containing protein [Zeaxanthinibacter enoshimensis]TDQ33365.1 IPT/TIG domain-containing protein [Zeaxanthinibacter enoshimensis]